MRKEKQEKQEKQLPVMDTPQPDPDKITNPVEPITQEQ